MIIQKSKLNNAIAFCFFITIFIISFILPLIYLRKINLLPNSDEIIVFNAKIAMNRINNIIPALNKKEITNSEELSEEKPQDDPVANYENEKEINNNIRGKISILERSYHKEGKKYDNFYVKNISGLEINFSKYASKKVNLIPKNKNAPMVLIVHTHTTESYLPTETNILEDNFCSRTQEKKYNVTAVGKKIKETLEKGGIKTIHDETIHDYPNFNVAYFRSADTIKKKLKLFSNIKIVIDVHRDSIEDPKGIVKPIYYLKNKENKIKASQFMIISGKNYKGWEKNLTLAVKVQKESELMFPGLARPLMFANTNYNQSIFPGSFLLEIGSNVNTIEESLRTAEMIAKILTSIIKKS